MGAFVVVGLVVEVVVVVRAVEVGVVVVVVEAVGVIDVVGPREVGSERKQREKWGEK